MRVGPAANVARLNVAEIITALWSFANAQGLLTDDINERTGAAGVTIDGVRLRDTAIDILGKPSPSNRVLGCDVIGDADERFRLHAGGIMQWGDGTGARDTQLQRDAANELGTPDDFNVGGTLDLAGNMELAARDMALVNGANDDVATGTVPYQRMNGPTTAWNITGFAGGVDGRILIFTNLVTFIGTINDRNAGSVAANRIHGPAHLDITVPQASSVIFRYDGTDSVWKTLAVGL